MVVSGRRQRVSSAGAGDAEVDEVGEVVLRRQHVGRFDVAVHQPYLVGGVQGFGDLFDDVHRAVGWQRSGLSSVCRSHAVDQPHA